MCFLLLIIFLLLIKHALFIHFFYFFYVSPIYCFSQEIRKQLRRLYKNGENTSCILQQKTSPADQLQLFVNNLSPEIISESLKLKVFADFIDLSSRLFCISPVLLMKIKEYETDCLIYQKFNVLCTPLFKILLFLVM